jgi:hypothetical protein
MTRYNASAVKIYNATNSKSRFRIKTYISLLINALAYYNAGVGVVGAIESRWVGSCFSSVHNFVE